MAKATKAPAGPSAPVMVNKGLPWMFILGMSALLLLAVFGLWSSFSGVGGFALPFFLKPTLLLGLGLLIYSYYVGIKPLAWIVWLVAIALLLFAWLGPTRSELVSEGLGDASSSVADSVTNLVTNGTLVTPPKPLSAEKQLRRVAVAKQEAEVAEAQRLAAIAAQTAAEDDAKRAYDASFMPAKVGPCLREFTNEVDCVTVKFSFKTEYERYAPPGHCIMVVGDGITSEPLGNESGWRRYRAEEATVVQFFTATGARCVP